MATDTSRRNVGAYVLGLLEADETLAFEDHLVTCDTCASEVEELLPTALQLGEVSPNQAVVLHMIQGTDPVEPAAVPRPGLSRRPVPRTSTPFAGTTDLVRRALARTTALHRRERPTPRHGQTGPPGPSSRRKGVLTAVSAAGVFLAFIVGTQFSSGSETSPPSGSAPTVNGSATPIEHGRQFDITDARSGVHAVMAVADASWGSQIWLTLGNVHGPLRCELVAVGKDGVSTVVASWRVPTPGYGIAEEPEPLTIQAATSILLRDTRDFLVRAVGSEGGTPFVLVTMPV
jgi:hypothetical protein